MQVEHFSRYGLLDLDDDDDDDEPVVEQTKRLVGPAAAQKLPPGSRPFGLHGAEMEDEGGLLV
jgi:hypothetical protein